MLQSEKPSSASLQAIEAAALQLLQAVRSAGKGFSSSQFPAPITGPKAATLAESFNSFLLSKARAGRSDKRVGSASPRDIQRALGLPKTSAFRHLDRLTKAGTIYRAGETAAVRYQLTAQPPIASS